MARRKPKACPDPEAAPAEDTPPHDPPAVEQPPKSMPVEPQAPDGIHRGNGRSVSVPAIAAKLAGLHSRDDAGLRPPKRQPSKLYHRLGLVIHCTAGRRPEKPEDVPGIMRRVQAYHQAPKRWVPVLDDKGKPVLKRDGKPKMKNVGGRGWSDAGYHWAIDPWGGGWQLRGWGVVGAHAKTAGHNLKAHGVVLLGDGSEMTDAEKAALLWFVADADRRFGKGFVRCHGDIQGVSKGCPGPVASEFVRSLDRG